MSVNTDERMKQLEKLDVYINDVETDLASAVNRLGWTLDYTSSDGEMVQCPLNVGHRVPKNRLERHLQLCTLRSEGYLKDDIFLPDACNSAASRNVVTIDGNLANTIILEAVKLDPNMKTGNLDVTRPIPRTSDRIVTEFTTDERRALYDYVVAQSEKETVKLDGLHLPFKSETKNEEPKSFLEVMAAERDARRRRVSYRTKKVSTNRKSHLEVMREVIQNQMELYTEWLNKDVEQEDTISIKEDKSYQSADNSCEKSNSVKDVQGNHWNSGKNPRQISSNQQYQDHLSDYSSRKHTHYNQSKRESSSHSGYDSRYSHSSYSRSRDDKSRDDRAGSSRWHDSHDSRSKYSSRERNEGSERRYREKDTRDRKDRRHSSPTEQNGKRKRESGHSERNSRRDQYYPTEDCNPNKVFKNEKEDEPRNGARSGVEIPLSKQVGIVERPDFLDGIMENVKKLADRRKEWSDESGPSVPKDIMDIKGSPQSSVKRKKSKKEKKSKHKRRKHSKNSKQPNSEGSDFSC